MKKAFTLIELLVVIAIIAILAAILFPVFAQAKTAAKKTQALSNVKQISTSQAIYSTDYDDLMPMSYSVRANGTVRWGTIVPFPANAVTNGGWETVIPEVEMHWATSMQPYIKNKQMYESGLQLTTTVAGDTYLNPGTSGLTMNGFLSQYSGTSITNVAITPSFWSGTGSWQYKGRAFTNPALRCNATVGAPCQFNPGATPQAGAVPSGNNYSAFFGLGAGWKPWTYGTTTQGGGVLMAYADTHAKAVRVGTALSPAFHTRGDTDPYALIGTTGSTFSYWTTSTGDCSNPGADTGTVQYVCYFRPDREQ